MLKKFIAVSLFVAVFGFTQLHAQTVAYVANGTDNTVSVIDTATNTVTSTIPVGTAPSGVVFAPDGSRA